MRRNGNFRSNNNRNNMYNNNYNRNNRNRPIPNRNKKTFRRTKPRQRYKKTTQAGVIFRDRQSKPNNNSINSKINDLVKQVKQISMSFAPKATNLNRGMKEPRYDKICTPMYMALNNKLISIFRTSNRVIKTTVYNKFHITVPGDREFIWYPYAIAFQNYDQGQQPIIGNNKVPDSLSNFIGFSSDNANILEIYKSSSSGITGTYRLIGATLKIYNTGSIMYKAGDYSIYKLNDNAGYPLWYSSEQVPDAGTAGDWMAVHQAIIKQDYSQVGVKANFAATDYTYINEYNVNQGNDIFTGTDEYLGNQYEENNDPYAKLNNNVIGNNIKYMLKFPLTTSGTQNYTVETWQVVEIVPAPASGLGTAAKIVDKTFTPEVIKEMSMISPFDKK